MEETKEKIIEEFLKTNTVLTSFLSMTKTELKIIKIYLENNLINLKAKTEEDDIKKQFKYDYLNPCDINNLDLLECMLNRKMDIDKHQGRYNWSNQNYGCEVCKNKCNFNNCIIKCIANIKYLLAEYNKEAEKKKVITEIELMDYLLNEINKGYEEKLEEDIFSKYNFIDILFTQVILASKFIILDKINKKTKKATFKYINLRKIGDTDKYINKLKSFFDGEEFEILEINLNDDYTGLEANELMTPYYIAAYLIYYGEVNNIDILKELNKYIDNAQKKNIATNRGMYFRYKELKKLNNLPYSKKAKEKLLEVFNYIFNKRYNSNVPFIPLNFVIYTTDINIVNDLKQLIGHYLWYWEYFKSSQVEEERYFEKSINEIVLDKYLAKRIYQENLKEGWTYFKKGVVVLKDFSNIIYANKNEQNTIMNILIEQMERNNNYYVNIIYGNKEEIDSILMQYPKLNNDLFNIKLDVEELNIKEVNEVLVNRLEKLQPLSSDVKEKLKEYIDSTYESCEIKNIQFVNNLYNKIVLDWNKIENINEKKSLPIKLDNIPNSIYRRNLKDIMQELDSLVGLEDIKIELNNLISLLQFNKKADIKMPSLNLHMVFTGNPGTGKTTVARLIGEILYNLGYTRQNKLVEVSAKDLIAEYIGQTGPKTYLAMKQAFGGVLFIDEAYAILGNEGTKGTYADECIATIVKTMEDHKDDLVVIFAGYENEMNKFIRYNPGLKSRIGYNINFKDYSVDELLDMFNKLVEKNNLKITNEALKLSEQTIRKASKTNNFGNGRFINNMLQEVLLEHAKNTANTNKKSDLLTLTEHDIVVSGIKVNRSNVVKKNDMREISDILLDLNKLVGLENVKNQISELVDLLEFNNKTNIDISKLNLHMIFTGNPGTGKTTVARLLAEILYNLGYTRQNKLIEVSAKDLIGEYVGHTGPKTQAIIEKSIGGLLFIDEAYSLMGSSFSAECIATIVKMMEDNRDDLIIIFAGYGNEMKKFIESNSGLMSRIGYNINFDDYNTEELMMMFEKTVKNNGFTITKDAIQLVEEILNSSRKTDNFGNGRFVNNLFNNILKVHSTNTKEISNEKELLTISENDIKVKDFIVKENKRKIGF